MTDQARADDAERLRRWRLVLGAAAEEGDEASASGEAGLPHLAGEDQRIDAALAAVYDAPGPQRGRRQGGLGASSPKVARWLGDIRRYFPSPVVQVLQKDAIERLHLQRLLLEPEMLAAVEPDLHLVTTLMELRHLLPDTTRATARQVIAKVVRQIEERLATAAQRSVSGALHRAARSRRPRPGDIDWHRTIRANLRHWQPEQRVLVPAQLVGYGRRQLALDKELVIAVDQSGSMAESVVYASVIASALAHVRALRTSVLAFDTEVVDLTDLLHDPVEVIFGIQLGGGTDINRAVAYAEQLVSRPADTVLVVVSDLFEGGDAHELVSRMAALVASGVAVVVVLALSDEGAPSYDHDLAARLAQVGVPSFASTPEAFAELVAAAIDHRDLERVALDHGFAMATPLG